MRLLLDTNVLIWALAEPARLTISARALLEDEQNEVFFSAASTWEAAIKATLGRVDFRVDPANLLAFARAAGFVELPVTSEVAMTVFALPLHHRDPFDRLLVAQALAMPAVLLTADAQLCAYSELVRLA